MAPVIPIAELPPYGAVLPQAVLSQPLGTWNPLLASKDQLLLRNISTGQALVREWNAAVSQPLGTYHPMLFAKDAFPPGKQYFDLPPTAVPALSIAVTSQPLGTWHRMVFGLDKVPSGKSTGPTEIPPRAGVVPIGVWSQQNGVPPILSQPPPYGLSTSLTELPPRAPAPLPVSITSQPLGFNLSLLATASGKPFSLKDQPNPTLVQGRQDTQSLGYNLNIYGLLPPPPFQNRNYDWPNPVLSLAKPGVTDQPQGFDLSLLATASAKPFNLNDQPNPAPLPNRAGINDTSFNTWRIEYGVPFAQTNWPNPTLGISRVGVWDQPLGFDLSLLATAGGKPFNLNDQPNATLGITRSVVDQPLGWNLSIYGTVPPPPFQGRNYDWPNPVRIPTRSGVSDQPLGTGPGLKDTFFGLAGKPNFDQPNPVLALSSVAAINAQLLGSPLPPLNPVNPFQGRNYDWPNPQVNISRVAAIEAQRLGNILPIDNIAGLKPFKQTEWPNPYLSPSAVALTAHTQHAILGIPAPKSLLDWPNPQVNVSRVVAIGAQPLGTNKLVNLLLIPFNNINQPNPVLAPSAFVAVNAQNHWVQQTIVPNGVITGANALLVIPAATAFPVQQCVTSVMVNYSQNFPWNASEPVSGTVSSTSVTKASP